jgi:hypothetical protein
MHHCYLIWQLLKTGIGLEAACWQWPQHRLGSQQGWRHTSQMARQGVEFRSQGACNTCHSGWFSSALCRTPVNCVSMCIAPSDGGARPEPRHTQLPREQRLQGRQRRQGCNVGTSAAGMSPGRWRGRSTPRASRLAPRSPASAPLWARARVGAPAAHPAPRPLTASAGRTAAEGLMHGIGLWSSQGAAQAKRWFQCICGAFVRDLSRAF